MPGAKLFTGKGRALLPAARRLQRAQPPVEAELDLPGPSTPATGAQAPGAPDQTRHSAQICDGLEKICVSV